MSEQTKIAANVLKDAASAVIKGTEIHGDTEKSFTMIGQLWQTYIVHAWMQRQNNLITPQDVAHLMVLVKIARASYGQSSDNHVDIAGYSALAAMLDPLNQMDKEVADALSTIDSGKEKPTVQSTGGARSS